MKAAAALLGLLLLGCGGGGGGGPTAPPPPPPPPPTGLFFSPAAAHGAEAVFLDADDRTAFGGPFLLRVEVFEATDLFGVSFDLGFANDRLKLTEGSEEEGDFLSEGGEVATELVVLRKPAGNVIVGITRLGDVGGVSGSGTLLTLEFTIREGMGKGELAFSKGDAIGPTGKVLTQYEFVGGDIEVKR